MRTTQTIHLPVPAPAAFAYLSAVTNEVEWRQSIVASGYVDGLTPAPGRDGFTEVDFGGRQVMMRWTITDLTPGRSVRWALDGNPWHGGGSYSVEPISEERSVIRATLEVRLHGFARILEPLMWFSFSRGLRNDLRSLRGALS